MFVAYYAVGAVIKKGNNTVPWIFRDFNRSHNLRKQDKSEQVTFHCSKALFHVHLPTVGTFHHKQGLVRAVRTAPYTAVCDALLLYIFPMNINFEAGDILAHQCILMKYLCSLSMISCDVKVNSIHWNIFDFPAALLK